MTISHTHDDEYELPSLLSFRYPSLLYVSIKGITSHMLQSIRDAVLVCIYNAM